MAASPGGAGPGTKGSPRIEQWRYQEQRARWASNQRIAAAALPLDANARERLVTELRVDEARRVQAVLDPAVRLAAGMSDATTPGATANRAGTGPGGAAAFPHATVVLAASGGTGALIGLALWNWQWAVEHAQVLAGLVTYPPTSPVAIAHAKLWSLVPQCGALLLSLGMSEAVLSQILSGLLGLVSFQALALVCYALGRNAVVAIGAPLVIFVSHASNYGIVYPIALLASSHTYGVIGLSLAVLCVALLGVGWYRTGGFLLAITPSVQVTLGVWTMAIVALAVLFDRELRPELRKSARAVLMGAALTLVSFGIHRALAPPVPAIDAETASRFFRSFVTFWDWHRQPVPLTSRGVMITAESIAVAAAWLAGPGRSFPASSRLLLRIVAIGGAGSIGLAAWSSVFAASMPDWVLVLMPGRLINVNILMAAAVLAGLLAATQQQTVRLFVIVAAAALLLSRGSPLWLFLGHGPLPVFDFQSGAVLTAGAAVAIGSALLSRRISVARAAEPDPDVTSPGTSPTIRRRRAGALVVGAASVAGFVLLAILAVAKSDRFQAGREVMSDWTTDPLLAETARGSGPLLTGGRLFLVQLRTRRPVLLDGGTLDTLPYAIEAGPAMDRILRDVYGIDLFNPPSEARNSGAVPPEANRKIWTAFSRARWQEIAREYGVSQVLTPAGWKLDLPLVASSTEFHLYEIPN